MNTSKPRKRNLYKTICLALCSGIIVYFGAVSGILVPSFIAGWLLALAGTVYFIMLEKPRGNIFLLISLAAALVFALAALCFGNKLEDHWLRLVIAFAVAALFQVPLWIRR